MQDSNSVTDYGITMIKLVSGEQLIGELYVNKEEGTITLCYPKLVVKYVDESNKLMVKLTDYIICTDDTYIELMMEHCICQAIPNTNLNNMYVKLIQDTTDDKYFDESNETKITHIGNVTLN